MGDGETGATYTDKEREKIMNISISTIARTACLALALTNQILSATGHPVLPIEDAQLESLITSGLTVAASLAAWWKNNSFTPAAIKADHMLAELRKK